VIGCAATVPRFSNSWDASVFDTPVQFSGPVDIGLNAVTFVSPADSKPGDGHMEITLVSVPLDMAESMEHDQAMILGYLKSTFLATSKPGMKSTERSFLGKTVEGETVSSTIPKPGELEYYLVPYTDGSMVLIALRWDASTTKDEAAAVMDAIAETFREAPRQK
jgi:hypothetical protein